MDQTADGKLKPIAIKAGITDYVNTEMKDGPLKEGDSLITFAGRRPKAAAGGSKSAEPGTAAEAVRAAVVEAVDGGRGGGR